MIRHVVRARVPESRQLVNELPVSFRVGDVELQITAREGDQVYEIKMPEIDTSKLPKYFDEQAAECRLVGRSGGVREVRNGT